MARLVGGQRSSPDGRTVLFSESGDGGGQGYSAYTRSTDVPPPVRLGTGIAQSLSPDGKSATGLLGIYVGEPSLFFSVGPGESGRCRREGIGVQGVRVDPDEKCSMTASEPGPGPRIFLRRFDGEPPGPQP